MSIDNYPMTPERQAKVDMFQMHLNALIQMAKDNGVVLSIDHVPDTPLTIGKYTMVGLARPARKQAEPMRGPCHICGTWTTIRRGDMYSHNTFNCHGYGCCPL